MAKCKRKENIIDAIQWQGDNFNEIVYNFPGILCGEKRQYLDVKTPEGVMRADTGDWIVRAHSSIVGEYFDVITAYYFEENYEPVTDEQVIEEMQRLEDE